MVFHLTKSNKYNLDYFGLNRIRELSTCRRIKNFIHNLKYLEQRITEAITTLAADA